MCIGVALFQKYFAYKTCRCGLEFGPARLKFSPSPWDSLACSSTHLNGKRHSFLCVSTKMTKLNREKTKLQTHSTTRWQVTCLKIRFFSYIQNLKSYKQRVKGITDNGYFVLSNNINTGIMMTLFLIHHPSNIAVSNLFSITFEDQKPKHYLEDIFVWSIASSQGKLKIPWAN